MTRYKKKFNFFLIFCICFPCPGITGHRRAITNIHVLHHLLISASDDGCVKLWNWKTGAFIRDLFYLSTGEIYLFTAKIFFYLVDFVKEISI